MKVAILYICTGEYTVFWREFYTTFEKNFLPNCSKEYFVFTDNEELINENQKNVRMTKHKYMGWPYDTLMRFDVFLKVEDEISQFDYTFFFNANMVCVNTVREDEFLQHHNQKINLIMVEHPGAYRLKPKYFPYDRNTKSTAYIPYNQGEFYVMGALNGGKTPVYLELIRALSKSTKIDLQNNIIAKVHDESYLNQYILSRDDCHILTPAYCNAEVYDLPFDKKIVMLDKSKYFDVHKIKNQKAEEGKIKRLLRRSYKFAKCNTMQFVDTYRGK